MREYRWTPYEFKIVFKFKCMIHGWRLKQFLSPSLNTTSLVQQLETNNWQKKQTATKCKVKKQKRLLCHSTQNLHEKCCAGYPSSVISYVTFTRHRPFWIVQATTCNKDRHMLMQKAWKYSALCWQASPAARSQSQTLWRGTWSCVLQFGQTSVYAPRLW